MSLFKNNINENIKVFLGGTCNESTWRDRLIKKLNINYFNPVVKDWTPECQKKEIQERENCDFCLYTITPLMTGCYSIAEVVDDSNKRPHKTILCILFEDDNKKFEEFQARSLKQVANMVRTNGGQVFSDLNEVADYLNKGGILYNER